MYWYLRIKNSLEDQKGQDLAEYGLLIGLIAVAVAAAVGLLGDRIDAAFDALTAALFV